MTVLWRVWALSTGYCRILNDHFNIVSKSQLEHQHWELPSVASIAGGTCCEIRKHHCRATCAFEGACKPQAQVLEAADYSGCCHLFSISFSHHLRQTQKETEVIMGKVSLEKQESHAKSGKHGICREVCHPPWAEEEK